MRDIFKQVLSNLAVFTLPFSLSAVVYFVINSATSSTLWLLVAPFLCMYFARKMVKNLFVFLVVHAVIIVFSLFVIGDGYLDAPVWVFLGVSTLISIVLKTRNELSLGVAFAVISAVLTFALMAVSQLVRVDTSQIHTQLLATFFVAQIINIVFSQMENVDYRINVITRINGFRDPPTRVLKANNKLITVFVAGIITLAAVVLFASGILLRLTEWGNAYLASRFDAAMEMHEQYWQTPEWAENPPMVEDEELGPGVIVQPFDFTVTSLDDLEEMARNHDEFMRNVAIFGTAAIVLLVLAFLFVFHKKLFRRRSGELEDASQDEVITLDKNLAQDFMNFMPWRKRQRRHPVRRAYYKKIKQFIKSGADVIKTDTTNKIETKITPMEDISGLTEKYEKVRYGK